MLTVTAFWTNDSCRIEEVTPELADIPNLAFRSANPDGAAMIEKHIENGSLTEPGSYVFIRGEKNRLLGFEKVNDKD